MDNRICYALCVVIAVCSLLPTSGCTKAELRSQAVAIVHQTASQARDRDKDYEAALREMLFQQLEAQRQERLAKFEAKKTAAKAQVYERYDAKRSEIEAEITRQMREVLEEPMKRMKQELDRQKTEALRTGSREQEIIAALQLAATMAESQRLQGKLYQEACQRERERRTQLLTRIDQIEPPEMLRSQISAQKIDELMSDLVLHNKAYRQAVDDARQALSDYILKYNPEQFAKDLLGELVGESIATALTPKINTLVGEWDAALRTGQENIFRIISEKAIPTSTPLTQETDRG